MKLKIAQLEDIDAILKLHSKYQINTIKEEDKKDGFVTTAFSKEELENIITKEQGIFIAIKNEKVMGYVMSASWYYWEKWDMFAFMVKHLSNLQYDGVTITKDNSYQYGPVCIDKSVRGTGVLEQLFNFALESFSKKYPILVTFVNKINPRSYEAHKRKLKLDTIDEFSFNGNQYYEMAYDTKNRVKLNDK